MPKRVLGYDFSNTVEYSLSNIIPFILSRTNTTSQDLLLEWKLFFPLPKIASFVPPKLEECRDVSHIPQFFVVIIFTLQLEHIFVVGIYFCSNHFANYHHITG